MLHNDVAIRKFDNAFYKESLIKAGQIPIWRKYMIPDIGSVTYVLLGNEMQHCSVLSWFVNENK